MALLSNVHKFYMYVQFVYIGIVTIRSSNCQHSFVTARMKNLNETRTLNSEKVQCPAGPARTRTEMEPKIFNSFRSVEIIIASGIYLTVIHYINAVVV